MQIRYICPFWGIENLDAKEFANKALDSGYNGIEINVPDNIDFIAELQNVITETQCVFIAQQWLPPKNESVEEYLDRMSMNLGRLAKLNPIFINSHTGKDYFSFNDNCSLLERCEMISKETQIKIIHEIHRGRFTYHTHSLLPYFEKFPNIQLTADFSHFCTVSESLLEDQEHILEEIIPRCYYIHARIGFDQSAQVNHPFAPEWKPNLERFTNWWQQIIDIAKKRGEKEFYVCPEFGPFPYMQQLPFTKQNVSNQWEINVEMMNFLREELK